MPHVNVQPTCGRCHVSLDLLLDYPRLIYGLSATFLGLLFLITLRSAIRRRRRPKPGTLSASVISTAINQQQLWLSEKSRGVSNNDAVMSSNHPPDRTQLKAEQKSYATHDAVDEGRSRQLPDSGGKTENGGSPFTWGVGGSGPGESTSWSPRPPPLTPPTLATGNFTFEDRRLSASVSAAGDLDVGFFDQPNPDYFSSSDSSSTALDTKQTTPVTPRRKSYTKILPIDSPRVVTDVELDHHALSFSPSSFPSSSPILPLAPHASFEPKEVNVQGEIISLTDESGAGWKRHTRVYGGGACLACMANGGHHGGFYGENVRPEDRR